MKLKDYEMHLFMVKDPRTGKELFFKSSKEAHRVADECMMREPKRLLFHTGHQMPFIEDGMVPNK